MLKEDHAKVPTPPGQQYSHQSCFDYHQHHAATTSCCASERSCCGSVGSLLTHNCQSKLPSDSTVTLHIPPPYYCPAACSCRRSTKVPTRQGYYWRDYNPGEIPQDAVAGIEDKYVGQVSFNGTLLPVTIYTDQNMAVGERSGKRIFTKNIKILCSADSANIYWEHIKYLQPSDEHMKHAIKGGHEDGHDLYIGVAYYEKEWNVGKVFNKGLQICDKAGNGVILPEFHILKYKPAPRRKVRQDYYWRDYVPGEIPQDAVRATELCIGQVTYDSCILPATIYPYNHVAIIVQNGKQIVKENIKILCSPDATRFYWERFPSIFGGIRFGAQPLPLGQQFSLFGTPGQASSSTVPSFGMSQNPTGLFGVQNQGTTNFGTSNQSGSIFGSSQNHSGVQNSFSFGIPQALGPILLKPLNENLVKEELSSEGNNSESPSVANVETEHTDVTTKSASSETITNTIVNSQISEATANSIQNQNVITPTQPINISVKPEDPIKHANQTENTTKLSDSESTQSTGTTAVEDGSTSSVTPQNIATVGQEQIKDTSPQLDDTPTQCIPAENQGNTININQAQMQGTSITFGVPQSQNPPSETQGSISFGIPNMQGNVTFGQPQIVNSSTQSDGSQIQSTPAQTFCWHTAQFGLTQVQGTPAMFGQPQIQGNSTTFGQPLGLGASAGFGQSQPQGSSTVFGGQQIQGTSTAFGQSSNQGNSTPFGQPQPQGSSTVFGGQQIQGTSTGFGQPSNQGISFGGFGQSQTQGNSTLFGSQQTQGVFPSSGSSQVQGGSSLFGQSQTQGFGSYNFGLGPPRSNLYGNPWPYSLQNDLVKGGHQDGTDLYIGKTFHEGEWKIGKVVSVHNYNDLLCVWGRCNETILFAEFEILKYRSD